MAPDLAAFVRVPRFVAVVVAGVIAATGADGLAGAR